MQSTPDHARCIACNYPLRGLPHPRCPECGLPFNPADPATMNLGKSPGPIARRLLRRTGLPTLFLTIATTVLFLISSGPPRNVTPHLTDTKYLMTTSPFKDNPRTKLDIAYTAAIYVLTFIIALIAFRTLSRLFAQRIHARREPKPRNHALRSILLLLCMSLCIATILTAWPIRVTRIWLASTMPPNRPGPALYPAQFSPNFCPVDLSDAEKITALQIASTSQWQPHRDRTAAMGLFLIEYRDQALATLHESISNDSDPEFRALAIHITSLIHNPKDADLFERLLSDPAPAVRAAAADAIDILRGPGLTQPNPLWTVSPPEIDVDPAINVSNLIPAEDPLSRPPSVRFLEQTRSQLETIMSTAQNADEREAAARALVNWPPTAFQLRFAEWGVWIADPAGNLPLVQSVIDEIPPFVHRLGNPYDSLAERYPQWMGEVTKPIVHITVDRPMALDMKVAIQFGRPWFAYPKPDDLALLHGRFPLPPPSTLPAARQIQSEMKRLDSAVLPSLPDLREGYPWLSPHHHYVFNDPRFGSYPGTLATSLGLRWQSLIVLPKETAWMHPPAVPADPKFKWWSDLRNVPSSYISSRDESDRFLYYDGPTYAKPPLLATLKENILTLKPTSQLAVEPARHAYRKDDQFQPLEQNATSLQKSREAFVIKVSNGQPTALRFSLPDDNQSIAKSLPANLPIAPKEVIPAFKKLLTDYGLTPEESDGLINAWKTQFFQKSGQRLLLRLSAPDYDALCPLSIKPPPSTLVRLGFVLTEF